MDNHAGNITEYYEALEKKEADIIREERLKKEKTTKPQCPIKDCSCPYHSYTTNCCLLDNPDDCDDYLCFKDW